MRDTLESILLQVSQNADIDKGELSIASRLIINSVCEGLTISRAGIWLYDDAMSLIKCQLLIDQGNHLDSESLALTRKEFPHYFKALDTERSIAANDALTHAATFEFAEVYLTPLGIASMLDVPIRHRGKMIGIICCEHQGEMRQWHEDEIVFAASLADLYGRAVSANERAVYEAKLIEANQTLEDNVKQRTLELEKTLQTLKTAQEKLVESEKMAALGNLVAGIAHEVNTPLGIALTSVTNCRDEVNAIHRDFEAQRLSEQSFKEFTQHCAQGLDLAEASLTRAAQLIQDFKRTSADQTSLEVETFNLDDYIPRICNPLKPMLKKEGIRLELDITPDLVIETCPGTIAQIITNLISNAQRHAFSESRDNTTPQIEKRVVVTCKHTPSGIALSVSDNGKGIPLAMHKKVFEPFFTTARDKGGTGLGLNILYNLVTQKLNGEITLTSQDNQGTTVGILIPAT
ncbi:sensor histidine kinase [Alteromonas gracilis]|uniref:sensor histidine kinase n=1 Tax=Alteromonas gracilis TaxID=1479524 RepID=UPI0030CD06FB